MSTSVPEHLVTERYALGISWNKLMMWLFLGSDAMMFGGLLASYAMLRGGDADWPLPSEVLGIWLTAAMTFTLIVSSVTMVRVCSFPGSNPADSSVRAARRIEVSPVRFRHRICRLRSESRRSSFSACSCWTWDCFFWSWRWNFVRSVIRSDSSLVMIFLRIARSFREIARWLRFGLPPPPPLMVCVRDHVLQFTDLCAELADCFLHCFDFVHFVR